MPSTVIIMRDAMSWIHFILAPGQDDCVVVMLEPVIQTLFFVCWQVFVAWLPCLLRNSDYVLWLVIFCIVHGVRDFKVCLVFLVGLLSHMYVWVVWRFWRSGDWGRILGGIGGMFTIFKRISSNNHTISLKHKDYRLVAVLKPLISQPLLISAIFRHWRHNRRNMI